MLEHALNLVLGLGTVFVGNFPAYFFPLFRMPNRKTAVTVTKCEGPANV